MGNKNSNISTSSHLSSSRHCYKDKNILYEQFFRACESGDLNTVQNLLSRLSPKRINSIQYQGRFPIDAAATNGHTHVVQYLLNYDYFRRPLIDPEKEHREYMTNLLISSLLDPDGRYIEHNLNDCMNFQPSFENVREHTTIDHAQASQFLMQITNASPIVRPCISLAVTRQCVDNLTQIIDHTYRKHVNQDCNELKKLYDAFHDHNNLNALIEIYTLTTPPMSTILRSNAGSYTALIYLNLKKFRNRAFNGTSYRGLKESPFNLEHYRSAMEHEHIIELNNLTSTSKSTQIADIYSEGKVNNAHLMVIKFDFTESSCPTALDLTKHPCISRMPFEEEVLVLPHTLFRVTHMEHTLSTQEHPYERLMITFKYVPMIPDRSLSSFIWKRSRLE